MRRGIYSIAILVLQLIIIVSGLVYVRGIAQQSNYHLMNVGQVLDGAK